MGFWNNAKRDREKGPGSHCWGLCIHWFDWTVHRLLRFLFNYDGRAGGGARALPRRDVVEPAVTRPCLEHDNTASNDAVRTGEQSKTGKVKAELTQEQINFAVSLGLQKYRSCGDKDAQGTGQEVREPDPGHVHYVLRF